MTGGKDREESLRFVVLVGLGVGLMFPTMLPAQTVTAADLVGVWQGAVEFKDIGDKYGKTPGKRNRRG